jgi:hypothetical protein
MGKLSPQSRKSIVHDWLTKKDVSGAAQRLSVAYNTAKLWIDKHLMAWGCKDESRSGRPPLISKEAAERVLELIHSEQQGGVRAVANIVHGEGLTSRVLGWRIVLDSMEERQSTDSSSFPSLSCHPLSRGVHK